MKTAITLGPRPRMSLPPLTAQYLSRLHRLVSHELASLRAGGEPIPGELTAKDVVAATLFRDYRELVKDPARREIGSWLIRRVIAQLEMDRPDQLREHSNGPTAVTTKEVDGRHGEPAREV